MPNFSANPPQAVTEQYDPANVVEFLLGNRRIQCVKGTFKEEIVEIPPTDPRLPVRQVEMFQCNTRIADPNDDIYGGTGKVVRVIGRSDAIVALMVDDLT